MSFTIRVGDIENVIADLRGLTPKAKDRIIAAMSEIAYDATKAGAGRHKKTGNLENSVYNRAIPNGREVGHDGEFLRRSYRGDGVGKDYSLFVLFGTRPHEIKPKRKKALRWTQNGNFVFSKFVKHPGYIGDNYLYQAADEAASKLPQLIDEAFR